MAPPMIPTPMTPTARSSGAAAAVCLVDARALSDRMTGISRPDVARHAAEPFVLGDPEVRVEGREKVTGRARYAADVHLADALQVAFARSPFAHARIVAVD